MNTKEHVLVLDTLSSTIPHELKINWLFVKGDLSAIVLPGFLFTLKALSTGCFTPLEWLQTSILSITYFWILLSCFCISNQLIGLEEDQANKPERPIAAGLLSPKEATFRLLICTLICLFLGASLGVIGFTITFLIATYLHNQLHWGHHWITKNILTATGIFCTVGAGWQLAMPLNTIIWTWLLVIFGMWTLLGSIQDLRDLKGDAATGRKTLPVVLGDANTRIYLSAGFLLLPIVLHVVVAPRPFVWTMVIWDIIFGGMSLMIAIRTFKLRTPKADNKTYKLFTLLFCLMIVSLFFLI